MPPPAGRWSSLLLLIVVAGCGRLNFDPADAAPSDAHGLDAAPHDAHGLDAASACRSDLDCTDSVDCTRDQCVDGDCFHTADDAVCAEMPEGRCDAELGCQYGTSCDTTTCQPSPCDASAMCLDGECVREPACRPGELCCGGVCGPCDDGSPCTIDNCDFEAGVCVSIPDDGKGCGDGIYCNGAETCRDATCESPGDPCAGLLCNETEDVCVGCLDHEDCPRVETDRGPCEPLPTAEPCDMTGTRDVLFNVSACMAGTCEVVGTMLDTEPCTLPSMDGVICAISGMTVWGPCLPSCGPMRSSIGTTDVLTCAAGACSEPETAMMSMACAPLPCLDGGTRDGGTCVPRETNCRDTFDDDCDGRIDCADSDCTDSCGDSSLCISDASC